ncbi:MAG: DUF3108 domain-containing protein [Bacteroidota bacterium]
MKRIFLSLILLLPLTFESTMAQDLIFPKKEKVTYLAHYGFLNAGEATVELVNDQANVKGTSCYHVRVEGRTTGMFRPFAKVDDIWETFVSKQTGLPLRFHRDITENKYTKVETVEFDQSAGKAHVRHVTKSRPQVKITAYHIL